MFKTTTKSENRTKNKMSQILREQPDNLSTASGTKSDASNKANLYKYKEKSAQIPSRDSDNLLNGSWYETVQDELSAPISATTMEIETSECTRPDIKIDNCDGESVFEATPTAVKVEPKTEPDHESTDREIAVEFLDVSNEAKYDRLVKDEKIKTPFKRRLSGNSNESRSSSPTSMQSTEEAKRTVTAKYGKNVPKKTRYDPKHRRESSGSGDGVELETSEEILARRQKQIDYGKNTIGYDNYTNAVAKKDRTKDHPWTPPKRTKYSRRAWDGLVKVWRKKLHCWDPAGMNDGPADEDAEASDDTELAEKMV